MNRPKQSAKSYGYCGLPGVASVGKSAAVIAPLVCARFHPRSVIDVGCGAGDWLRAFQDCGVLSIQGCDGPWVPASSLCIALQHFREVDFYERLPDLGHFELACCLEVVEHVAPEVGERIIELLCRSADLILFSAAVPGQGGYEHIHERYQAFWIERFALLGYSAHDCIRPLIWMNRDVSWWYQQNCLVFANATAREKHGLVQEPILTSLIHPTLYEEKRNPRNYSLKAMIRHLPHYAVREVGGRLRGLGWSFTPSGCCEDLNDGRRSGSGVIQR